MAVHQKSPHFLFLLLAMLFTTTLAFPMEQEADRISSLPGQPRVEFSHFSGYVTVDEVDGRALFYWLTEAVSPADKPLVLWLNGGPGCSSIAYGASEEIGPFRINKNGSSLYLNEYAWNREANILFLESPAGVGFSYTNTSSNLKESGDERTARDALVFMINWMQRFPQYQHRNFYLSGESYAGHYVPQLAKKIHDYNKEHSKPFINLKGFIVGNALMDDQYDNIGSVLYLWSHALISDASYKSILNYCNFTSDDSNKKCDDAFKYAYRHEFGKIDPYNIYTPTCQNPQQSTTIRFKNTRHSHLRRAIFGYDPCTENYAEKYYNLREVQEALHANTTGIRYNWTSCSNVIKNWTDSPNSMLPIYKELIGAGLRIWVFSGDTDSVVPVTSTRFSINHLNLTIRKRWYPWYSGNEVGGWTEVYHGLTFATVRGAGHEVPLFQPKRALTLFQSFLAGKHLPKS